jgi:hypothetical protein
LGRHNGARFRIRPKDLVALAQKIDQVPSETAAGIENYHSWRNPAAEKLVEEMDVDVAELLVEGEHGGNTTQATLMFRFARKALLR